MIKIRKLTMMCFYLVYRPYSNFINFPTNVFYSKRKKITVQDSKQEHESYLVFMSLYPPLIWNNSLIFLCFSWHWHFLKKIGHLFWRIFFQFRIFWCFLISRLLYIFGRNITKVMFYPYRWLDQEVHDVSLSHY